MLRALGISFVLSQSSHVTILTAVVDNPRNHVSLVVTFSRVNFREITIYIALIALNPVFAYVCFRIAEPRHV